MSTYINDYKFAKKEWGWEGGVAGGGGRGRTKEGRGMCYSVCVGCNSMIACKRTLAANLKE